MMKLVLAVTLLSMSIAQANAQSARGTTTPQGIVRSDKLYEAPAFAIFIPGWSRLYSPYMRERGMINMPEPDTLQRVEYEIMERLALDEGLVLDAADIIDLVVTAAGNEDSKREEIIVNAMKELPRLLSLPPKYFRGTKNGRAIDRIEGDALIRRLGDLEELIKADRKGIVERGVKIGLTRKDQYLRANVQHLDIRGFKLGQHAGDLSKRANDAELQRDAELQSMVRAGAMTGGFARLPSSGNGPALSVGRGGNVTASDRGVSLAYTCKGKLYSAELSQTFNSEVGVAAIVQQLEGKYGAPDMWADAEGGRRILYWGGKGEVAFYQRGHVPPFDHLSAEVNGRSFSLHLQSPKLSKEAENCIEEEAERKKKSELLQMEL